MSRLSDRTQVLDAMPWLRSKETVLPWPCVNRWIGCLSSVVLRNPINVSDWSRRSNSPSREITHRLHWDCTVLHPLSYELLHLGATWLYPVLLLSRTQCLLSSKSKVLFMKLSDHQPPNGQLLTSLFSLPLSPINCNVIPNIIFQLTQLFSPNLIDYARCEKQK